VAGSAARSLQAGIPKPHSLVLIGDVGEGRAAWALPSDERQSIAFMKTAAWPSAFRIRQNSSR
jgi:hypothetical protein